MPLLDFRKFAMNFMARSALLSWRSNWFESLRPEDALTFQMGMARSLTAAPAHA